MTESPELIAAIQARSETLTQSEARLVAELMRAPREVALLSAADFARRVGLHEATCSRLARKLGFDGYAAFRAAVQAEYLTTEPAARMAATLGEAGHDPLSHLVEAEIAALRNLKDHVDDARIARMAAMLEGRRIVVFAQGNATALGEQARRRLSRMAVDVRVIGGGARDLAEGALGLGPGDAVLLFAFRRQPPGYAALMRRAAEVGAATLVVSDTLGPALRPAPDMLVAAPRTGGPGGYQTLTVPMLILNALILALGARAGGEAMDQLGRLGGLIAEFAADRGGQD